MNSLSKVLAVAVILAIAVVGYLASGWISLGNFRPLTLTISFSAVLGFAIVILKRWEIGLFTFFIWIVLEDLLRKYIGNDMILYLVKDVLMILVYISYFVPRLLNWRQSSGIRSPLLAPLAVWFVWALAEAFNPGIDHPLVPLIGLRMSFFYIPMIFLGYSVALAESRLMAFLKLNIFLGTVVAVLGIIQAIFGLEFLNPAGFVPYLRLYLVRAVAGTGAAVPRPNSVFADAGRFAQYLYVIIVLCLGTLASGRLTKRAASRRESSPAWIWICLLILSVGLFVSGQRAAMYLLGLGIPVLVVFRHYEARALRGAKSGMPLLKIGVLLLVGFMCLWSLFPQRVQATYDFYTKTLLPADMGLEVPYRVDSLVWQFKYALSQSPLLGHGTGTNSLGRQYLYNMTDFYSPAGSSMSGVEMGYGALVWEWGLVGLAIWIWWGLSLMRQSLRITLALAGTRFFWLAATISYLLFSIIFLWLFLGLQVYQNYVTAAFVWFLAGVLLGLPKIAEESSHRER